MLSAYIEEDMYKMEQFIRVRNMKKKTYIAWKYTIYFTSNKSLLNTCPVPDGVLSAGDMSVNKAKCLLSWNIYSSDIAAHRVEI